MAQNLMGNFRNRNEQDLIADLIEEAIEQRGAYVRYIVRDELNPDFMLGEAPMSEFKEGYQLPMFIESMESFNGNGDFYDAFGISKIDNAIFQVGARKFRLEVSEKAMLDRPREGDLIYISFSDSLWEITKVKMDLKYYQVGKNYSYRLICKLFTYSHEKIENPESEFSGLSTSQDLDDEGLKLLLGINPDRMVEEQDIIEQEHSKSEVVPDDDNFGF